MLLLCVNVVVVCVNVVVMIVVVYLTCSVSLSLSLSLRIAGISVETMVLELDDLLERHYNNTTRLELDQVTLNVNMTIHLLNKFFVKANK